MTQTQTLKQTLLERIEAQEDAGVMLLIRELLDNYNIAQRKDKEFQQTLLMRVSVIRLLCKDLETCDLALVNAFLQGVLEGREANTTL